MFTPVKELSIPEISSKFHIFPPLGLASTALGDKKKKLFLLLLSLDTSHTRTVSWSPFPSFLLRTDGVIVGRDGTFLGVIGSGEKRKEIQGLEKEEEGTNTLSPATYRSLTQFAIKLLSAVPYHSATTLDATVDMMHFLLLVFFFS